MSRQFVIFIALLTLLLSASGVPAGFSQNEQPSEEGKPTYYSVDTPFYTLRGPETPMIALIQTEFEVEYIGDYLELDMKRAGSALKLLGYVDFNDNILLVVNGGWMEGVMLRVESVYEQDAELHVVVVTDDPPQQYRDSEFSSPAAQMYTPALVTVIPRFQGRLIIHAVPAEWAAGGDLRGIQLVIAPLSDDEEEPAPPDTTGSN
jgi:hypothetical protein